MTILLIVAGVVAWIVLVAIALRELAGSS